MCIPSPDQLTEIKVPDSRYFFQQSFKYISLRLKSNRHNFLLFDCRVKDLPHDLLDCIVIIRLSTNLSTNWSQIFVQLGKRIIYCFTLRNFEHGLGGIQTIFKGGLNQRHIEEPLSTNLSVNNNFRILPTKILNITMKSFDKTSNSSDHKIGLIQNSGFIS